MPLSLLLWSIVILKVSINTKNTTKSIKLDKERHYLCLCFASKKSEQIISTSYRCSMIFVKLFNSLHELSDSTEQHWRILLQIFMVVILYRNDSKDVVIDERRPQISEFARFQIFLTVVVNVLCDKKIQNCIAQKLETLIGACYRVFTECWVSESFKQQNLKIE